MATKIQGEGTKPLKFGILGAAQIAPPVLIWTAKSHPEVEVYAIAARDLGRAQAFAKKHGIEKAYQGYQGMSRNKASSYIRHQLLVLECLQTCHSTDKSSQEHNKLTHFTCSITG